MVYRKKAYGTKKQKRWYFDATIGRNVPIIGGTGIKMGTGVLGKRSLTTAVKDIVRKGVEATHYKVFSSNTSGTTLTHNTLTTFNLLGNIPRGDDWNNRNGDIIHLSCIDLDLTFYANTSQSLLNDIVFNYWIVRDEDEYLNATDNFGSGLGSGKMINTPILMTQGIWDPKKVSVVKKGSFTISPSYSSPPFLPIHRRSAKIMICPNAKFVYETQTNFGKNPNYYLVVVATHYNSVPGTTQLGDVYLDGMVKFKNSQ